MQLPLPSRYVRGKTYRAVPFVTPFAPSGLFISKFEIRTEMLNLAGVFIWEVMISCWIGAGSGRKRVAYREIQGFFSGINEGCEKIRT